MVTCFGDDVEGNNCVEALGFDKKNGCADLSALPGDLINVEDAFSEDEIMMG